MALTITMKQHDTRPKQEIGLLEPDPADITTTQVVDLTDASSAKLIVAVPGAGSDSFESVLAFASDRTTGVVIWTPISTDTATEGQYNAEVEITWSDDGVETYPNDGYFTIQINADLG